MMQLFKPPNMVKKIKFVPCSDLLQIYQCTFLSNEEQEFGLEAQSFLCDYLSDPGLGSRMRLVCNKTNKRTLQ